MEKKYYIAKNPASMWDPTRMVIDQRKERQKIANAKYKKTPKAKQAAAIYYKRTIDARKKTQLIWRNKCKERLVFLEDFYEKHKETQ